MQSSSPRILSVDPGYDRVGVAVLERVDGKERLLFSDCIQTEKSDPYEHRLRAVGERLENLIDEYQPAIFACESIFFAKNQKTAIDVAGSRGMILYIATKHGLPIFEYTPNQIKIAVTGHGRSDKEQVIFMIKRLVSIDKATALDDEYDAIAVGLTCLATERFET
jgi:crossover junction endodeoxyribonuclease RuvC